MVNINLTAYVSILSLTLIASQAAASNGHISKSRSRFNRISTFPVYLNNLDLASESVAEIIDAADDGNVLVYTDSEQGTLGFIDIHDPNHPSPLGIVPLSGEPTSVSIVGPYALVGVNTSESFIQPTGHLAVVDINKQVIITTIALAGQPDSVKVSPDRRYCAVVIENERDETITVNGVEGGLPQAPAGLLQIVDIWRSRNPKNWSIRNVDLTGLANYAEEDPEPEFVDINRQNLAVVTFQENNHLAIVDLKKAKIRYDFNAGTVDLKGIDTTEDRLISLTESLSDVPREPDAVTWLDPFRFATANEGDLFGGSRGFSIFSRRGRLLFDSGNELERIAVKHGHYLDDRSGNKGTEPEAITFGRFRGRGYIFVGTERSNFVAVYRDHRSARPEFLQILPVGLGPEGLLAIPHRNLLVVSSEVDDPTYGVRATVQIYKLGQRAPYPSIVSANNEQGSPIPWASLSGMTPLPHNEDTVLAVSDSYFAESKVFTINTRERPAVITKAITITGGTGNYDPEGIAVAPDGTYWIASEGDGNATRANRILQITPAGKILSEIGLPYTIEACRAASENTGSLGAGFEGLTIVGNERDYKLYIAQQRGWDYTSTDCESLDDDHENANVGEPRHSRIWIYDPDAQEWSHIAYELEPVPEIASWVGLSEISRSPHGDFVFIERDNRSGDFATLKTLVLVKASAFEDSRITRQEKNIVDLQPQLKSTNGWITDKPEGVAITPRGQVFVVTDNDGADGWSGETWFLRLGKFRRLFR